MLHEHGCIYLRHILSDILAIHLYPYSCIELGLVCRCVTVFEANRVVASKMEQAG